MTKRMVLAMVVALVGCGGSGAGGGGVGDPCSDGASCAGELFCLVVGDDPAAGTCTDLPPSCDGNVDCSCLADYDAGCASRQGCIGLRGEYTVSCDQVGYRQAGETCSPAFDCDLGLYCFQEVEGDIGTCTPLPDACAAPTTCDCFAGLCPDRQLCVVSSGYATIQCHD